MVCRYLSTSNATRRDLVEQRGRSLAKLLLGLVACAGTQWDGQRLVSDAVVPERRREVDRWPVNCRIDRFVTTNHAQPISTTVNTEKHTFYVTGDKFP
jgi:hypothetical protein